MTNSEDGNLSIPIADIRAICLAYLNSLEADGHKTITIDTPFYNQVKLEHLTDMTVYDEKLFNLGSVADEIDFLKLGLADGAITYVSCEFQHIAALFSFIALKLNKIEEASD